MTPSVVYYQMKLASIANEEKLTRMFNSENMEMKHTSTVTGANASEESASSTHAPIICTTVIDQVSS